MDEHEPNDWKAARAIAVAVTRAGYDPESREDMERLADHLRANADFQSRLAQTRTRRGRWLTILVSATIPLLLTAVWQWLAAAFHSAVSALPPGGPPR